MWGQVGQVGGGDKWRTGEGEGGRLVGQVGGQVGGQVKGTEGRWVGQVAL